MGNDDSDSDEDRNEYQNEDMMADDEMAGVYLNDLDREEEYDKVNLEYE